MTQWSVNARKDLVRKDIVIAVVAVAAIAAITFGLAKMRPDLPILKAHSGDAKTASSGSSDKAVIHVNGEAVSEAEFNAFLNAVPAQQRAMLGGPAGKRELANEIVRMKALEQEGHRLGIENDPELKSQIELLKIQATAQHALQKIVEQKSEKAIQDAYAKEKKNSLSLRHIVIGFQGGAIPVRGGGSRSEAEAKQRAATLEARIRGGEDFGEVAKKESDDVDSGARGGSLGPVRADQLPPEIGGVVAKLKPGEVSAPVKTQYGYHLFNVTEPTLDDLRPMLQQQVQNEIAQQEIQRLQKAAKVELDPQFFPPAPAVPAQNAPVPPGGGVH